MFTHCLDNNSECGLLFCCPGMAATAKHGQNPGDLGVNMPDRDFRVFTEKVFYF